MAYVHHTSQVTTIISSHNFAIQKLSFYVRKKKHGARIWILGTHYLSRSKFSIACVDLKNWNNMISMRRQPSSLCSFCFSSYECQSKVRLPGSSRDLESSLASHNGFKLFMKEYSYFHTHAFFIHRLFIVRKTYYCIN